MIDQRCVYINCFLCDSEFVQTVNHSTVPYEETLGAKRKKKKETFY